MTTYDETFVDGILIIYNEHYYCAQHGAWTYYWNEKTNAVEYCYSADRTSYPPKDVSVISINGVY